MNKPESFEVSEYSEPSLNMGEAFALIKQTAQEIAAEQPDPSMKLWVDMVGDTLRVHYMSSEVLLPYRRAAAEDRAQTAVREFVSALKKGFRSKSKTALSLKELKDQEGSTVEKVSLNERYYYKLWKCYQVSV